MPTGVVAAAREKDGVEGAVAGVGKILPDALALMHSKIVSCLVAVVSQVEDQRLWGAVLADGGDGVVRGEDGQGIIEPRIAIGE